MSHYPQLLNSRSYSKGMQTPEILEGQQLFTGAKNFRMGDVGIMSAGRDIIIYHGFDKDGSAYITRIARWLSQIDAKRAQMGILSKRTSGTGTWFLESSEFTTWYRGEHKVLWVTGMPGAGKTVLSSIAVDFLQKEIRAHSTGEYTVMFFQCQYKDQPTPSDILLTFLRQLVEETRPDTIAIIEPVFEEARSTPLAEEEIFSLLERIMALYQKVYIVVDALDELQDETRDHLLPLLSSLFKANLLLTSRPTDVSKNLRESERELIHLRILKQNRLDIELFVSTALKSTHRLSEILESPQSISDKIITKINEKSDGMFLIASLQVESLKQCISPRDMLEEIEQLPSGATDMYNLTMKRIEDQGKAKHSLALRALLWVTYAKTYLTLERLRCALAISTQSGFDRDALSPESLILSCCCGLLVVDNSTKYVRLVHFTADDFLRNLLNPLFKSPHTFIARHCISYLTFSPAPLEPHPIDISDSDSNITLNEDSSQDCIPFPYAYSNWAIHAKRASSEPEGGGIETLVSKFVVSCKNYTCQISTGSGWQIPTRSASSGPEIIQPIHLIALHGFSYILSSVRSGWDERSSTGSTPLHLAAYKGHNDIVLALVSDKPNRANTVDDHGYTPLMLACQQGHTEVVETILSSKETVDVNARTTLHGATALTFATTWGRSSTVELLLTHTQTTGDPLRRVDLHAQDYQGQTALMIASALGHEEIVKMFMSCSDVNVRQSTAFGFTAFTEAAIRGSIPIFKLLLAHHPHAFDPEKDTALIRAAKFGREAMVRYLLSVQGIDINVRCGAGNTPLIVAAGDGHDTICALLLGQQRMNVNAQNSTGQTALIQATRSARADKTITHFLNHPDVSINVQDNDGFTTLMYAVDLDLAWLVKRLLARDGIQVNARNRFGKTALMLACTRGRKEMVELLLDHKDVDLNVRDKNWQSALTLTSSSAGDSRKDIVAALLRSMSAKLSGTTPTR